MVWSPFVDEIPPRQSSKKWGIQDASRDAANFVRSKIAATFGADRLISKKSLVRNSLGLPNQRRAGWSVARAQWGFWYLILKIVSL
ncbi:TPA: hypothetical protein QDB14_002531 [Burkholderia vietnamiensis]|nr:hypothetical protein [Burkholderia vietnamiensis]HEP6274461.1 hypothetical protein [Burkholderia vietnamiensis]HEP6283960.1 hypothetical protein [Burkholderia vietnamiensis]HEP6309426.1 hypothetical protein [Burkholderia vietnamiensis]